MEIFKSQISAKFDLEIEQSTLRFDLLSKRNSKIYTNFLLLISLF